MSNAAGGEALHGRPVRGEGCSTRALRCPTVGAGGDGSLGRCLPRKPTSLSSSTHAYGAALSTSAPAAIGVRATTPRPVRGSLATSKHSMPLVKAGVGETE